MKCPKCGKRRAKGKPCKFCKRIRQAAYQRTRKGFLRHRFRLIRLRCKREGPRIYTTMTSEQFVAWGMESEHFLQLFYVWTTSGYRKWLVPSVDRIDEALGYEPSNVQWMSWAENYRKECLRKGYDPFAKADPRSMDCIHELDDIVPDWL